MSDQAAENYKDKFNAGHCWDLMSFLRVCCHVFIFHSGRVDKKRDKMERQILDSQERAFWNVHRPPVRHQYCDSFSLHDIIEWHIFQEIHTQQRQTSSTN